MVDRIELPKRKKRSDSGLTELEMLFLDLYLRTDVEVHKIYGWVFKAAAGKTIALVKSTANGLLSSMDAQVFLEERRAQLLGELSGDKVEEAEILSEMPSDFADIVMKRVWKEFTDNGFNSKSTEILLRKVMSEIDAEKAVEPPIRVLSENCNTCRYRLFVEKNTVDECILCKYKEYGNKNGLKYTYRNQLNKQKDEI